MSDVAEVFGEIISSYSRAQAIEDGVLVDVSKLAAEYGITYPVARSLGVHAMCGPPKGSIQDYTGRVWDVLTMFRSAAKQGGAQVSFTVKIGRERITFKAICGPGDSAEPVITIMLPEED